MAVPSEKAKRYDRQLRLWGDHGQSAVESAVICLINATSTGTEILKNLVLPGVGSYTIIDNKCVTYMDLGSNFFVTADSVGKNRAQVVVSSLQELNLEVRGSYIEDTYESVLSGNADFFTQFTVVIASELSSTSLLRLSRVLWKTSTPLVVARSFGLIGYLRLAFPKHEIIESHPDNFLDDLRLDCPFPGLMSYMNGIDLNCLDNTKHGNVPYLVILYKCLNNWKIQHKGAFPKSYREKNQIKEMIRSEIRKTDDGVPLEEENFDEAMKNISKITSTIIPSAIQKIFEDRACINITPQSSNFWLLVRAVKEFVSNEGNGKLPLKGSLPDMTSSSDMYVELQRMYQVQAVEDLNIVTDRLNQVLAGIGKSSNPIPKSEIKRFCSNSRFLRVLEYRSLEEEYQSPQQDELRIHLECPDSDLVYYVLLRAADHFFSVYNSYPGENSGPLESDIIQLKSIVSGILQNWGLSGVMISDDCLTEFCRYGGGEIHSVAAFIGGVAAQEIIKLITHQFVPFNNTLIYNAATSKTMTVIL